MGSPGELLSRRCVALLKNALRPDVWPNSELKLAWFDKILMTVETQQPNFSNVCTALELLGFLLGILVSLAARMRGKSSRSSVEQQTRSDELSVLLLSLTNFKHCPLSLLLTKIADFCLNIAFVDCVCSAAKGADPAVVQAATARHRRLHDLSQLEGHPLGTLAADATDEHLPHRAGVVERRLAARGARLSVRLRQQGRLRGAHQLREVSQSQVVYSPRMCESYHAAQ